MELKIGCDPELWIFDKKLGKIISAHGLFPGTKAEPHPVTHGAVQVDGMAAEFNINPASSAEEFTLYVLSVLKDLRDLIKQHNPDLEFDFVFSPVAEFGKEYIDAQPLEAKQLGCTPDFNAYEDGAMNPTPDAEMPFRTASGHIHIGWGTDYDIKDPEHIEACCMMAKQMDVYVGGGVTATGDETEFKRRELYGKAGAFRPKSYGVEYRTSSNVWLGGAEWIENIFCRTRDAFNELLDGYRAYENGDYAVKAINTGHRLRDYYSDYRLYYGNYSPVTVDTLDKLVEAAKRDFLMEALMDEDEQPDVEIELWDEEEDIDLIDIRPADHIGIADLFPPQPVINNPWADVNMDMLVADNVAAPARVVRVNQGEFRLEAIDVDEAI